MQERDGHDPVEARVRTRITRESLDEPGLFGDLGAGSDGAVLIFQGRVRDMDEGRTVTGLAYEAYDEMADEELRAICREAADRFAVGAISAAHRVGELEPGEVSVSIGVAAPHRAACYEASRFVIEEIKARLPVWKHERYADGDAVWVGAPEGLAARAEARPEAGEDSAKDEG